MAKRKPTFVESISCLVVLFGLILFGTIYMGIAIQVLLLASTIFAVVLGCRLGYSWAEMEEGIIRQLTKGMGTIFIIMTVGAVVSTWIFSGTVPMILYYGLQTIAPKSFLVTAFLLTGLISILTGTAWGATATAGVALMGIATSIGVPPPMAAGAITGGAIAGGKFSPLADTTNLCPLVCDTTIWEHIKYAATTVIPAILISLVAYYFLGQNLAFDDVTIGVGVVELTSNLQQLYGFSPWMILPVLVILVGSIMQKPTVPLLLISSAVAVVVGVFCNGMDISDGINSIFSGFSPAMFGNLEAAQSPEIVSLVSRGGIQSMMPTVVTVFCGYAFAGVVEMMGCFAVILETLSKRVKTPKQLSFATMLCSTMLVFTAGVASISILMTGALFKETYNEMGVDRRNLGRTLEDAGVMFLPIVPWGSSALFYFGVLGVSAWDYWMWAFPCVLVIAIEIIYVMCGQGLPRKQLEVTQGEIRAYPRG